MFSPFTRGAARAMHLNGIKSRRGRRGLKRLANRRARHYRSQAVVRILQGEEDVVELVDRFTERDTN